MDWWTFTGAYNLNEIFNLKAQLSMPFSLE